MRRPRARCPPPPPPPPPSVSGRWGSPDRRPRRLPAAPAPPANGSPAAVPAVPVIAAVTAAVAATAGAVAVAGRRTSCPARRAAPAGASMGRRPAGGGLCAPAAGDGRWTV